MIKVGITGQEGFVGSHIYNTLGLYPDKYERIPYHISYFQDKNKLRDFVAQCDVVIHLAALNRHEDTQVIYDTNIELVQKLIEALRESNSTAHILFSSSSQEEKDNLYGKSKKVGREMLINWAKESGGKFTGMIIPNVYGPFGAPNYNSFIATFCYKLTHGETPEVLNDGEVKLIYVGELVQEFLNQVERKEGNKAYVVPSTATKKVTEVLNYLTDYQNQYFKNGQIPPLESKFELNLFNTFRSYMDYETHYPVHFKQNIDPRGSFVEVIRTEVGGQSSYSTTVPGITRGDHFHTRKIERFAVIKGKARIQLRKIDTDKILNFSLDGSSPSYVDMPIWYTHNITNIGDEELITLFWINEPYNPVDPDTYFVKV